jgi:hypothetical protein
VALVELPLALVELPLALVELPLALVELPVVPILESESLCLDQSLAPLELLEIQA